MVVAVVSRKISNGNNVKAGVSRVLDNIQMDIYNSIDNLLLTSRTRNVYYDRIIIIANCLVSDTDDILGNLHEYWLESCNNTSIVVLFQDGCSDAFLRVRDAFLNTFMSPMCTALMVSGQTIDLYVELCREEIASINKNHNVDYVVDVDTITDSADYAPYEEPVTTSEPEQAVVQEVVEEVAQEPVPQKPTKKRFGLFGKLFGKGSNTNDSEATSDTLNENFSSIQDNFDGTTESSENSEYSDNFTGSTNTEFSDNSDEQGVDFNAENSGVDTEFTPSVNDDEQQKLDITSQQTSSVDAPKVGFGFTSKPLDVDKFFGNTPTLNTSFLSELDAAAAEYASSTESSDQDLDDFDEVTTSAEVDEGNYVSNPASVLPSSGIEDLEPHNIDIKDNTDILASAEEVLSKTQMSLANMTNLLGQESPDDAITDLSDEDLPTFDSDDEFEEEDAGVVDSVSSMFSNVGSERVIPQPQTTSIEKQDDDEQEEVGSVQLNLKGISPKLDSAVAKLDAESRVVERVVEKIVEKPVEVIKEVPVKTKGRKRDFLENIIKGNYKVILVTGDRGSGVTSMAMDIASAFARHTKVLYFDCDIRFHGLLNYIDYEEFCNNRDQVRSGISLCKSARALYDCVMKYADNIDILTVDYGTEFSVLERALSVASEAVEEVMGTYPVIIVDVPFDCLHCVKNLASIGNVVFTVESSRRGIMNFATLISDLGVESLPPRVQRRFFNMGTLVFTKADNNVNVRKLVDGVKDFIEFDDIDWFDLPMLMRESPISMESMEMFTK